MLDNTGGGGKTNNVRQYMGRGRQTLLDNTGGGEKTNNFRQYRGRGIDKQC